MAHNDHKKDERFKYQRADQSKWKKSCGSVATRASLPIGLMFFAAWLGEILMGSGKTESKTNQILLPRSAGTAVLKELFLFLSPYHIDKLWKYFRKKLREVAGVCAPSNKNYGTILYVCKTSVVVIVSVLFHFICMKMDFQSQVGIDGAATKLQAV